MSGPSVRTGAPTPSASSTISTARSTPKQKPYSLANKTSILIFCSRLIPQTIHRPIRARYPRRAILPSHLFHIGQCSKPENHRERPNNELLSIDYLNRLTRPPERPTPNTYQPLLCSRNLPTIWTRIQKRYRQTFVVYPFSLQDHLTHTSCQVRDKYHPCRSRRADEKPC